jgi:two-component system chemotaxis response regulator CheY
LRRCAWVRGGINQSETALGLVFALKINLCKTAKKRGVVMKVLVVDDYSTMRRIIRNLLTQIGYTEIDEASDGNDALQKLRAVHYGLVISDWNMEPMTGFDLLKQVRADDKLKTTPFIMVTAESKTENVVAAKQAGVDNYIVKPFNAATLQSKINAVIPPKAH